MTIGVPIDSVLRESSSVKVKQTEKVKTKIKKMHTPAAISKEEMKKKFATLHEQLRQLWIVSLQCFSLGILRAFEDHLPRASYYSASFNTGIINNLDDILRRVMQNPICTQYKK